MKHVSYQDIPSVKQFQSDSSITFATRADDEILVHLDWLLGRYHAYAGKGNVYNGKGKPYFEKETKKTVQPIILSEIYLGAKYWIKSYKEKHPRMKAERHPAVKALYDAAVTGLRKVFNRCEADEVPDRIEEIFGRDVNEKGKKTDETKNAHVFSDQMLARCRIRFKGGRAYHHGLDPLAEGPLLPGLVPLNTETFYSDVTRGGSPTNKGWGAFIMTLEREFYMATHWLDEPGVPNIFHSSYTGGSTVCMAGTMFAKDGVIKGIRPDSGHYKPDEHHMAAALLALQMFSVPMETLEVHDKKGKPLGTAHDFVKGKLDWQKFEQVAAVRRSDKQIQTPPKSSPMAPGPKPPAHVGLPPTQGGSTAPANPGFPGSSGASPAPVNPAFQGTSGASQAPVDHYKRTPQA